MQYRSQDCAATDDDDEEEDGRWNANDVNVG